MPGDNKDFLIRVKADIRDALNQFGILRKENEKLGKSLSGKNDNNAFSNLGIRNFKAVRREIKLVEASYKRLAASGKLSQKELSVAARQSRRRIKELRRELDGAKDSAVSFGRAIGAAVSIEAVRRVLLQADAFNVLQVRIKTATKETGDYARISRQLSEITSETGGDLRTTVSLFQNLARSGGDLNATNQQMIRLTRTVQQLGVISGATQTQQRAGLLQFSQGLAAGVFRAEEFNSIIENLPEVASRIEKGLGKTRGELRKMLLDGKLLSSDVFQSLVSQSKEISEEFAEIPRSLERSTRSLSTSFDRVLSKLDSVVNATGTLSGIFDNISLNLEQFSELELTAFTEGDLKNKIIEVQNEIVRLKDESTLLGTALLGPLSDFGGALALKSQLADLKELLRLRSQGGAIDRGQSSTLPAISGPNKAQKDAAVEAEKYIKRLEKQLELLDANTEATVRFEIEQGKLINLLPEEAHLLLQSAIALDERRAALEKEKAIKSDRTADNQFIQSLRNEINALSLTERAQEQLNAVRGLSSNASNTQKREVEQLTGVLFDQSRALEVNNQLQNVRIRLLQAQGRTVEASRIKLEKEFGDLLESLKQQGDTAGIDIVNKLINTEQARIKLNELQKEYTLTLQNLSTQEQRLKTDIEVGLISERQGRSDIIALHKDTRAELDQLIPRMRELAESIGPEAVASVDNYAQQIRRLGLVVDELAARVNTAVDSGLTDFFDEWASGSKSAADAFESFADVVIGEIRRIFAEQASNEIQGLFKSATGDSAGGLFSSIFAGVFHDGGIIGSGGSSRRVPASVFTNAPRYHNGNGIPGLKADERPGIFQTGERILSRYEVANGVGGGNSIQLGGIVIQAVDSKSVLDQMDNIKDELSTMLSSVSAELNLGGGG